MSGQDRRAESRDTFHDLGTARIARGLRRRVRWFLPRRIEMVCLGPGRSGTALLTRVFADRYRTMHEPEPHRILDLLIDHVDRGDDGPLGAYLQARDRRLRLEADIAGFYAPIAPLLADLKPHARFVLLVRHPRDWARSVVNRQVRPGARSPRWQAYWRTISPASEPRPDDGPLVEHGLVSLDTLLGRWSRAMTVPLDAVPPDRLLAVRTEEIVARAGDLERFVGARPDSLDRRWGRTNQAPESGVFDRLDPSYVDDRIHEVGGSALARVIPEDPLAG